MTSITTIAAGDLISDSRADINNNFSALNSGKIETSVLDTDSSLAADSDSKIPSQKAVKAYVDTGGILDSSATVKGILKLSVAPVSSINPIAVGDNDTRVPTAAQVGYIPTSDQKAALAGTTGTPSSSNKYVTNDDTTGTGSVVRTSLSFFSFGNGSDGTYTLDGAQAAVGGLFSKNSNTYTLLKDAKFANLTISNGVTLETNGYILTTNGTLANAGTIQNNGADGGGGAPSYSYHAPGGAGGIGNTLTAGKTGQDGAIAGVNGGAGGAGVAGTAASPSLGSNGVAGGAGGAAGGGGGAAGGAGTATSEIITSSLSQNATLTAGSEVSLRATYSAYGATSLAALSPSAGSGSGGGGYANSGTTAGSGGGAGGTGGIIEIIAETITNTGTIKANGGSGGVGGTTLGGDAGGGGGGGGGTGGVIVLIYKTLTAGTITVTGGTKGAGGAKSGSGSNGADGTDGLAGKIYKVLVS